MQHDENIPTILRPQADAAVSWINETQARSYELTGLVDYEQALHAEAGEGYELGLVLCDGEICAREQVGLIRQVMDTSSVLSMRRKERFPRFSILRSVYEAVGSKPRWGAISLWCCSSTVDSGDPHVAASYVAMRLLEWSKRLERLEGKSSASRVSRIRWPLKLRSLGK